MGVTEFIDCHLIGHTLHITFSVHYEIQIGPGTIIDGFEILEQIGKGGFSHVHKRIRHTCIQL